jgi:hypothetical protein
MKVAIRNILLTMVLQLLTCTGFSEEHEEDIELMETETAAQATESSPQIEPEDQAEGTETFVPTEEISEDLSVPFPVDI